MKFLLFLSVAASVVILGESIQCYDCESSNTQKCDKNKHIKDNCTACSVIPKNDAHGTVVRKCSTSSVTDTPDLCVKDLCNAEQPPVPPTAVPSPTTLPPKTKGGPLKCYDCLSNHTHFCNYTDEANIKENCVECWKYESKTIPDTIKHMCSVEAKGNRPEYMVCTENLCNGKDFQIPSTANPSLNNGTSSNTTVTTAPNDGTSSNTTVTTAPNNDTSSNTTVTTAPNDGTSSNTTVTTAPTTGTPPNTTVTAAPTTGASTSKTESPPSSTTPKPSAGGSAGLYSATSITILSIISVLCSIA